MLGKVEVIARSNTLDNAVALANAWLLKEQHEGSAHNVTLQFVQELPGLDGNCNRMGGGFTAVAHYEEA